jgi:plastocyanin
MRHLLLTLALVAAALSVGSAADAAARLPKTWTIVISRLAFGPSPADAHVGDTVVWVNQDSFLHSATANDHSFDVAIPVHGSGRLTLNKAGAFAYACKYHPAMKAQLVVNK